MTVLDPNIESAFTLLLSSCADCCHIWQWSREILPVESWNIIDLAQIFPIHQLEQSYQGGIQLNSWARVYIFTGSVFEHTLH